MRDHVISRHSPDELRALQKVVVDTILAARPEPDGFPATEFAAPGTFEHYVARQLYWHFRGALEEGEDPPDACLAHPDNAVKANAAMAVGLDALVALSEVRENEGELVRAAQASWAASRMKGIPMLALNDLVHRAADLLERADDKEILEFEHEVLAAAWFLELGSERANKVSRRSKVLAASSEATFESKWGEMNATGVDCWTKLGIFGGEGDVAAALESMRQCNQISIEVEKLAENASMCNWLKNLGYHHNFGYLIYVASPMERWNLEEFGCSEAKMVEGITFYDYHVCGKVFKEVMKFDIFRLGWITSPLAFYCEYILYFCIVLLNEVI